MLNPPLLNASFGLTSCKKVIKAPQDKGKLPSKDVKPMSDPIIEQNPMILIQKISLVQTEEWLKKGLRYNCDKKKWYVGPTIPSAQAVAYVQELDEEVSNVFHDEHGNIWSYVTISSPYRQGALGRDSVVRLKEAETSWRL